MPAIRPVLIVGAGDHADLVAALRARGLGPMLASGIEQAVRLLRNFHVDVVVCVRVSPDDVRTLAARAPTVVVGASEPEAWDAGAAGFVASGATLAALAEVVYRVARGERQVGVPHPEKGAVLPGF